MKSSLVLIFAAFAAGSLFAADSTPTNRTAAAIAKLQSATNYSWTVQLEMPGSGFTPGPVKGRTEKGGLAIVSQDFNENTIQAAFKGEKVAVKVEDKWQLIDEAEGFPAMMAGWIAVTGTPADEAANLLKKTKELKAGDADVLAGDYTADGAKELLWFKPRAASGFPTPPAPKNAKGSVKFWIKDGALVKFQSHLQGLVSFGPDQEERDFEVTRTVEIQDVGKTKLDLPAEAKKKLVPE